MKKGQRVKVSPHNDNDGYDSFRDKVLIITHVASNTAQHPGYDNAVYPKKLYDLADAETGDQIWCSLYDYELVEI